MNYTANYGLGLPEKTEKASLDVLNENFRIIDAYLSGSGGGGGSGGGESGVEGVPLLVGTADNPTYLYNLERGVYVATGTFYIHPNSDVKINVAYKQLLLKGSTSATTGVRYAVVLDPVNLRYKEYKLKSDATYELTTMAVASHEKTANKVTKIDENNTDTQYPSAKAVYTALQNVLNPTANEDTALLGKELANANNWTLGAGWSGSFTSGFTHANGNTEPLTFTPTITAGKLYQVTFKSSVRMTTTNLFVQVGNSTQFNLYGEDSTNETLNGNISIGVLAVDTTGLVFTPDSSFTGTLTNISLKEITGSYEAVQQYFDTNEAVSFEIHVTPRGLENVYIGQATGAMNTTGHENVGIGVNVLSQNTSGFWNVGIGKDCLKNNTGGSRNLALGYNALMSNEVGQRNVALGTFAMTQMKDGDWNIAIGSDSMNEATSCEKNVAVGFNTLTHNKGNNNVAIGADALTKNTSGIQNVGIGQSALGGNTTGNSNVAIGHNAGVANTTAQGNVAIGWAALYKNTTGEKNIAIGMGAGKTITTGKRNIVIGVEPTVEATGSYQLNIGDLLKGSLISGASYLSLNGGLRLPSIPTSATGNADEVYAEEWTFTLEDGSEVTKKVLMK